MSRVPCELSGPVSPQSRRLSKKYANLSHKASKEGNLEEARKHAESAVRYDPNNAIAYLNLGVINNRLGDTEGAQEAYRKALVREFYKRISPQQKETYIQKKDKNGKASGVSLTDMVMKYWNVHKRRSDPILNLKGDLQRGRLIYEAKCSRKCHQPDGWGLTDGSYPQIAGQYREVQIKQLLDIRQRNRDNPTMFRFALPSEVGGEQAISDVSAYIAQLKMTRHNGVGPGNFLREGQSLYERFCQRCHGKNGEGNAKEFYPRIQGQHFNYLVRQYNWIRDNKRRNAHPLKMFQIGYMTDSEVNKVMDYVSRLKPQPQDLSDSSLVPNHQRDTLQGVPAAEEKLDGGGLF
ncbi:MAG: c-type cytochrome [Magnetococcales bacterium]|nr:c-type cytochrome [Magnetococcales bacterium]